MKKCLFALVGLLSLFGFIACNMNDVGNETENGFSPENIAQKKEKYAQILNTSWETTDIKNDISIKTISFGEDSITIDGIKYNIDQNKDFYFYDELDDYSKESVGSKYAEYLYLYIKIDDRCFKIQERDSSYEFYEYETLSICQNYKISLNQTFFNRSYDIAHFKLVSDNNSSSNTEENSSTYTGSYSFNNSTGSQQNGTITLKDGNWSYSGNKSNPAASNGSYTVNGSKVTLNWTAASNNVSETFTISTSDNSSTWKSEYTGTSLLFSMLFGVVSTEMTFTYSE